MSGLLTEFKVLKAPDSFRTSLGQFGNEAFKAFRKANKTMHDIELLTSHLNEQWNKILKLVFHKVCRRGFLYLYVTTY